MVPRGPWHGLTVAQESPKIAPRWPQELCSGYSLRGKKTYWLLCKSHSDIEHHLCSHRSFCDCCRVCHPSFSCLLERMPLISYLNKHDTKRMAPIDTCSEEHAPHQRETKGWRTRRQTITTIYERRDGARWLSEVCRGVNKPFSKCCLPGVSRYMGDGRSKLMYIWVHIYISLWWCNELFQMAWVISGYQWAHRAFSMVCTWKIIPKR